MEARVSNKAEALRHDLAERFSQQKATIQANTEAALRTLLNCIPVENTFSTKARISETPLRPFLNSTRILFENFVRINYSNDPYDYYNSKSYSRFAAYLKETKA